MKDFSESRTKNMPISKKVVAVFSDKTPVYGSDWLKFVRDYKANFEQYKGETNKELWDKFVVYTSVEFYKKHLENYNEDFRFQMQEFKEGNMLFEVMEKNVWNKAAADASALKNYYAGNQANYKWEASADVLVFNCSSEKIAEDALVALKNGKDWKKLADESNATIQSDSGRYELSQITGAENAGNITPGNYSKIAKNTDGSASFVKYVHLYPAGMQRSFDEARGLVINDYQNVLEQKWLASLKAKYPVKVNEAVFKTLLK
jgi:peptidyl-prolyl cis-trans isomerase SurA